MGSGASAEASEAEEKFRNSINKVRLSKALIGKAPQSNYSPSPTPQRPNRDELLQMVKSAKAEVNNDWHAINEKKQPKNNNLSKAKWRRASTVTSRYYINDTNKQEDDIKCSLCSQCVVYDGYSCRICTDSFHLPCLIDKGHVTKPEAEALKRLYTTCGWSCYYCENLLNLLTPDELTDVYSIFEKFDVDKDAEITREEYVAYRIREYERVEQSAIPEFERRFINSNFSRMDGDGSGTIDWTEFATDEACRKLGLKRKKDLVSYLTQKEKQTIKRKFQQFDVDGDGEVDEAEIRGRYVEMYQGIEKRRQSTITNSLPPLKSRHNLKRGSVPAVSRYGHLVEAQVETKEMRNFVDNRTSFLLESSKKGTLTWEQYLQEEALYVLSCRPNKLMKKLMGSV